MTVKPTKEMYGTRVGIIVDSSITSGYSSDTHIDLCLEGVLLTDGCKRKNIGGEPSYDHFPDQIVLENVTRPNAHSLSHHPLKCGVKRIQLDNSYVLAIYVPKPEQPDGGQSE